ncbi:MAG: helix-hairpin-helix domain-containing protein [Flavobacteriales bacterium]
MSVINGIKDYLEMHKRERRGISVLVFLLGVIFLIMFLIPYVVKPEVTGRAEMESTIKALLEAERKYNEQLANKPPENEEPFLESAFQRSTPKQNKTSKKLFAFDPNTCSDNDWKKLGLNSGQIKTLNNFKNKGGKFYKPKDVEKMYTISSEQYAELAPYIAINQSQFEDRRPKNWNNTEWENKDETSEDKGSPDVKNNEEEFKETLLININAADTLELDRLAGIGPYYARKIKQYRTELGGFISKDQLLEIWNFKPETLEKIRNNINLGEDSVRQISINHCNAEELVKHPYFNWKMANALVNYRETHGPYSSIEEITNSHLISKEACLKMKPYLKLN